MEKAQRIADLRAKAQSLRAAARSSGVERQPRGQAWHAQEREHQAILQRLDPHLRVSTATADDLPATARGIQR